MNLTTDRKELAKAVKTALKAASKLKGHPAMNGVLLTANAKTESLTVAGADGTVQIQCRVKCEHISEEGAAVLPPIAGEMVRMLPGDTVEIGEDAVHPNMLTLKAGQCEYALPVLSAKDFPGVLSDYPGEFIHGKGLNQDKMLFF